MTSYIWKAENMTPRLLTAIGAIVIQWSMIDHEITHMCENWWGKAFPGESVPRPFGRRLDGLRVLAEKVYFRDPAEHRIFRWYLHRLSEFSSKRDDISHGLPVKALHPYKKYEYDALKIPFPSKPTKFKKMDVEKMENLRNALIAFYSETIQVSLAFSQAQQASLRHILVAPKRRGLQLQSRARNPKLPQLHPPPSTWQG